MAKVVLLTTIVKLGGVDWSNNFKQCTVTPSRDLKDVSCFGDIFKKYATGLPDWTATLDFVDDFVDNGFNEALWGWFNGGIEVAFETRPTSASVSASNPTYTGNVLFTNVPVFGATHGEVSAGSMTLQGSGNLSRATT